MSDNSERDERVAKEINRIRKEFRRTCHNELDDYLDQLDEQTGLPMLNTFIAYMGQGWSVAVGLKLTEPTQPETDIEQKAKESGIEIVKA